MNGVLSFMPYGSESPDLLKLRSEVLRMVYSISLIRDVTADFQHLGNRDLRKLVNLLYPTKRDEENTPVDFLQEENLRGLISNYRNNEPSEGGNVK